MPLDAMPQGDRADGAGATLSASGYRASPGGSTAAPGASGGLVRWYVLAIEAGRERHVLGCREAAGIELYLPTVERIVERRRGKRYVSRWPLLPGYLFAQLDLDMPSTWRLIDAPHVLGLVRGAGCIVAVADAQMARVRALETEAGVIPARVATRFKIGQRVRLMEGPFASFDGPVREIRDVKGTRVMMVGLSLLGRFTLVPAEQEWLEDV